MACKERVAWETDKTYFNVTNCPLLTIKSCVKNNKYLSN